MPAPFADLAAFRALLAERPAPDLEARAQAEAHNAQLTKPPGALGRLEEIALWLAGWQGKAKPTIERAQVVIFAGNHGVAARGVSAFPAEVTAQMVANFQGGGAAINQLCKTFGASLEVYPLELERPTQDFTQGPAMSAQELCAALAAGWEAVDPEADLLVVGEMGIANTCAAAALAAALLGGESAQWAGRGTGVDDAGLARKAAVIEEALAHHGRALEEPLEALRRLGGREIAAMVGAIACARARRIGVVLDGFICCSAALALQQAGGALDHCIAGHASAEQAHLRLLEALEKEPLLSLGLRLGEGSGAALALGIVRAALACHGGMATFAQASVSRS